MEDSLGIPLTGIVDQKERTATEILRQEISKESNTASYYNNAYKAIRTMAKIIIELITGGSDLKFTLENGPQVITREMKKRQELNALATIMPDEMKPVIAKYFADTLKNELGDELSRNIVANLPAGVQIIDQVQDPVAIHQLNQMQAQMEDTMSELQMAKQENEDLKKQLFQAQMSMLNGREQRIQDWQKFIIQEQDKMMLEGAKVDNQAVKTENEAVKADNDMALRQQELMIKAAESAINRQQGETDAYLQGIQDGVDEFERGMGG